MELKWKNIKETLRDVYLRVVFFFLNRERKKHRPNISISLLLEMSYVSFYKAFKKISIIINKSIKKIWPSSFALKFFDYF